MPNANRPAGFRPVQNFISGGWTGMLQTFAIAAADATSIGVGDLVKTVTGNDTAAPPSGQVTPVVVPGYGQCTRVTANTDIPLGVVVGFVTNYANLNIPSEYHAASSGLRYALVCTDPSTVYEVQANAAITVASTVGKNATYTLGAVNAATGVSTMQVDISSVNTTATLPLKIVQIAPKVEYDPTDLTNVKLWVTLNSNTFSEGTGSVGT